MNTGHSDIFALAHRQLLLETENVIFASGPPYVDVSAPGVG